MPGPASVVTQGQLVALVMAVAGVALLVLALALQARSRPGGVRTRTRAALVGALLMTAGLALLLVRRLDPAALSRVLTLTATLFAAVRAEHEGQSPTPFGRLDDLQGRQLAVRCTDGSAGVLPKEML